MLNFIALRKKRNTNTGREECRRNCFVRGRFDFSSNAAFSVLLFSFDIFFFFILVVMAHVAGFVFYTPGSN